MNVQPINAEVSRWRSWPWLLALVAFAFVASAYWYARSHPAAAFKGLVTEGALVSVTLTGGQVYYGTVLQSDPAFIQLGSVYYVQATTDAEGRPANRLVRRDRNDWHGPLWMVVPLERVQLLEQVGSGSRLAALMAEEQAAAAR